MIRTERPVVPSVIRFVRATGILTALISALLFAGCEESGSDSEPFASHDFMDNNPDVYLALGDSMTCGAPGFSVTQYPEKLASKLGKRVINAGIGGEKSSGGAARAVSLLNAYKPGFILILYGANDVFEHDAEYTIRSLTSIINNAKSRGTIPVLATVAPAYGHYGFISKDAPELNSRIKQLAKEQGLLVADLAGAFGDRQDLLLRDNLHPNEEGTELMAITFAATLQ